jgi:hypothetical protein
MNIEIYYDPIAHVVINDFFTENEYETLYSLIEKIEPEMDAGTIFDYSKNGEMLNEKFKKNKNFWPYSRMDVIESGIIGVIIEKKMWTDEMKNLYKNVKDSTFNYYYNTNKSEIMISKYTKNDFYNEHTDRLRSITGNIWMSKDVVEGGNFILKNVHGEIKQINYKNNTCLLFPSECLHGVTPIENDCKRFSIQYFSDINYRVL